MKVTLLPDIPDTVLSQYSNLSPFLAKLLYNRAVHPEEVAEFLYGTDIGDPYLIPDMKAFVDRIQKAVDSDEKIMIHGDYDVDGISASAIIYLYLTDVLKLHNVTVHLPDRHGDGYGLSQKTIDRCIEEGNTLLITVDCGIKDKKLVDYAIEKGIDVIVSDHHTPPDELPASLALIHPMFYSSKNLCGAGIAWKMVQALDEAFGKDASETYVDLAGLGTICDVMELKGENRVIVKKALQSMRKSPRIGLAALMESARIIPHDLDTYHIGYMIGPRLNAAGRLASADASLQLLLSTEEAAAVEQAASLSTLNLRRQTETTEAMNKADAKLDPRQSIHIIYIPSVNPGVIGLVAGKLTEKTSKPVIILTDDPAAGVLVGSCRSIDEMDMTECLAAVSEHLLGYGGHKKAAGCKVHIDNLTAFTAKAEAYAKTLLGTTVSEKHIQVDIKLDLSTAALAQLYKEIELMAPFGESNPRPICISDVVIESVFTMGENGKHMKVLLHDVNNLTPKITGVGFNMDGSQYKRGDRVEVIYTISQNIWNGRTEMQLNLIDIIK